MSGEFNIGDAVIVDNWGRGFITRAPARDGTLEVRTEDGAVLALVSEVQPSGDRSPLLRERLPYVLWICANKREVIANRNYRPIWSRHHGQMAIQANFAEWINDIKQEIFLFDDQIDPWESPTERDRLEGGAGALRLRRRYLQRMTDGPPLRKITHAQENGPAARQR